jgi:methylmalonyl-CoA mutase N-terminal domain/subunit
MAKAIEPVFQRCVSKKLLLVHRLVSIVVSQTIVGVNKYRLEKEAPIDILEIDNTAVRLEQVESLKKVKSNRDEKKVKEALDAITECVKTLRRQPARFGSEMLLMYDATLGRNLRCLRKSCRTL